MSGTVIGGLWLVSAWCIDWVISGWISWDWLINALQGVAAMIFVWLLFPLLIPAFISVFVNKLAANIERREYVDRPQGLDLPFGPELRMDLKFAAYAVLLNVLALPVYFIPGLNLIIYYVLNAHLLGKQYFMMVARRQVGAAGIKPAIKQQRMMIYALGMVIVLCSTIPIFNLLAPAFATAIMVHAFHSERF